ncbi:hypothetical protein MIR68_001093 [Amoeboaphelidium protococcarum]|nr:hypothetical protein MIR68_001093 [Amoeboaphelidium protococcarum]
MQYYSKLFCLVAALSSNALLYKRQASEVGDQSIYQVMLQILSGSGELRQTMDNIQKLPQFRNILNGNGSEIQGDAVNGQITFFAPINDAYSKLPQQLVQLLNQTNSSVVAPNPRNINEIRTAFNVLSGLYSYHTLNSSYDLSANLTTSANQNVTAETLLSPLNATIWRGSAVSPVPFSPGQSTYNQSQVAQSARAPVLDTGVGLHYNELNITTGFSCSNGYLYLVDGITSPLWFVNISLSDLPALTPLPRLINIFSKK